MSTRFLTPFRHLLAIGATAVVLLGISSWGFAADKSSPAQSHSPAAASNQERLISIVLLLRNHRDLDEHTLSDAAPGSTVVAKPPYYQVKVGSDAYVVTSIDKPYFDQAEKVAADIKDPAVRDAVEHHKAWLAVDWGRKDAPGDVRSAYQHIAKMAAALAGPDTLAFYNPDTDQFADFDDNVVAQLKSDDPLQAFAGSAGASTSTAAGGSDVIAVDGNDSTMKKAEAEAKSRWHDFVAAFNEKNGSDFTVKGRIAEGENAEYMWLRVSAIDGEAVHGTLDNEPAQLSNLHLGQDLHIKLDDVDDWAYIGRDKKPRGGFTIKALDQIAQASQTSANPAAPSPPSAQHSHSPSP